MTGSLSQHADFEEVNDKGHTVLACILRGDSDVRSINRATTLSRHQINYYFEKLERLDLIFVMRPDGYTTERENGQVRRFRKPKQAALTAAGMTYFEWKSREIPVEQYEDMDRDELVQKVRDLEDRVETIERSFDAFRRQVQRELRQ